MAITYTDNLHLGLQLDKNDYLDWDVLTDNWRKVDAAYAGGGGGGSAAPVFASPAAVGSASTVVGIATQGTIPD